MKLIFAIINKDDSHRVQGILTKSGFSVTKLATTGGFLLAGNSTFIIGTDDEKVGEVLSIIKENSKKRTEQIPASSTFGVGVTATQNVDITVGGATIFVTDVDRFEKY
ncbi:MAG: cyclic-di-AMP receptor [Oscillospiraceae bacterium]